ncbi:MAG TPA: hypothetical protein VK436_07285 [Methanocella sp.]|nr:hypothetical protein [Methanocella sp.]
MLIEGNLLIGILIIVSIALVLVVLFIRLKVKKDSPTTSGSSFLSFLSRGQGTAEGEDAGDTEESGGDTVQNNSNELDDGLSGLSLSGLSKPGDDLSLSPPPDDLDDNIMSPNPEQNATKTAATKKTKKGKTPPPGPGEMIKGLFGSIGSLFGPRKNKETTKKEVKDIDEQLNQVLQESQNFGMDISPSARVPDIGIFAESTSMREIDNSLRNLQQPTTSAKPEPSKTQPLEGMNPYAINGSNNLDFKVPTVSPAIPDSKKPLENTQSKPSEQPKPPQETPKSEPKPSDNIFNASDKNDKTGDLLSEIAADSVKEEKVDMSIMKDMKDVPIRCEELESDLQSILSQVTMSVQVGGKKKNS